MLSATGAVLSGGHPGQGAHIRQYPFCGVAHSTDTASEVSRATWIVERSPPMRCLSCVLLVLLLLGTTVLAQGVAPKRTPSRYPLRAPSEATASLRVLPPSAPGCPMGKAHSP